MLKFIFNQTCIFVPNPLNMSSQRGNATRNRPQKYKNSSKFKNNLHDKSLTTKKINETVISDCCARCTEIIQWKIDYKKYKLLSQAKKCVNCLEKKVTNSYHIICSQCGLKDSLCRKCKVKLQPVEESKESTEEKDIKEVEKVRNKEDKEDIDKGIKELDEGDKNLMKITKVQTNLKTTVLTDYIENNPLNNLTFRSHP